MSHPHNDMITWGKLLSKVPAIVRDAFNFPAPVVEVAGAAGPADRP